MSELFITEHAFKRLKERCGLNKRGAKSLTSKALRDGVSREDISGNFGDYIDNLYLQYAGTGNNIRVYGMNIFVFSDSRLLTVLHVPKNLIRRLGAMANNEKERT